MEYEVKLGEFEGPLDLLLHLIKKNKIDIFDIPISEITEQYIYYINQLREYNMELSSEFIVMAAQLLQIKSKMLLPQEDDDGEEVDPRDELAHKIFEYKVFKEISTYLRQKEDNFVKIHFKDPEYRESIAPVNVDININDILNSFKKVMAMNNISSESKVVHRIASETIKLEDKIEELKFKISKQREFKFSSLFNYPTSRTNILVTFLALLELIKANQVIFRQDKTCDDILIIRSTGD